MAFSSISDLWNKWNIRGFVLLSLSLQVFPILFAPLRKKIANRHIIFLLWLAYLMADSVAVYGIGLISHNQGNSCAHVAEVDISLQALWASFLLLHLGGPDTITAFSLEDNLLWGRHLLGLIFQVGVAVYLFVRIFPSDMSLLIPTMLVFLSGVIKNSERIASLHLSSLPRLQESMLRRPERDWNAYLRMNEELNTLRVRHSDAAALAESIVVKHAYYFFQIFQVFIGDLMFKYHEREMSRNYFHKVSAMDALRVISAELNFMYEALYTKALVTRSKCSYILRFVAFTDLALALVLFNRLKKHGLPKLDVDITHSLILGGMALDVIALFMLILSDWTVAGIQWYDTRSAKIGSFFRGLLSAMDNLRKPRSAKCEAEPNGNAMYDVLDTQFIFRRWSESISACNILSEFLKSPRKLHQHDQSWGNTALSYICSFPWHMAEKIISYFHQASETIAGLCGSREIIKIANTRYVSTNPFIQDLWIFILKEVRRKSMRALDETELREIYEARGDLFLTYKPGGAVGQRLSRYVKEVSYDSSILSWHIATEIWDNMEKHTGRNDKREFSKILSDYMLYLLLNQNDVVSGVAGVAQMTLADMVLDLSSKLTRNASNDVEGLCRGWYNGRFGRFTIPELHEGFELAREMEGLGETKWEVMSGVWVEMLSYAASHIKGEAHVRVLSKGGELLGFVWLLMAHLGCFYKTPWGAFYRR